MEQLIVFCKAPRVGFVKSRLAATVGPEAACRHYGEMVGRLLDHLQGIEGATLAVTPDDAIGEVSRWKRRPSWKAVGQGPGDLGQRMQQAFAQAFEAGCERVVVIGSDAPEVTESDVREAFLALRRDDLVIGPAEDGGFWLIGLTQPQPDLFRDQEWGTNQVCAETLRRAQSRRMLVSCLRLLSDIDTEEDWKRYCARIGR